MKKILVVCALSKELNTVKEKIKSLDIRNAKISFFTTWMGNYNTILNLTRFLENNSFDFVVNIWVCWYKDKKINAFQVARIYNLSNSKELIVPNIIDFLKLESIITSEKIVYDSNVLLDENFVDMESYGFEIVSDSFKIPRIIIKIPVDKIWEETKNFDFEKAKDYLSNNLDYNELFEKIVFYLDKQKKEDSLDKYFSNYSFTFSEKEIFKKYYYRYKSLVWDDFLYYFENNKHLEKKVFLKYLEIFLDWYLIK